MFEGVFEESILKRAQKKNLISISIYDLRKWGLGKHKQVDDSPYGGGAGMVMRVDVVDSAISDIKSKIKDPWPGRQKPKTQIKNAKITGSDLRTANRQLQTILLTPQGERLTQKKVRSFAIQARYSNLVLICGHYEGFDERIRELADEEISIGDYILTGGEIPAMVLVDAVSRLIPGVLGREESATFETFEKNLLEYPQYTRPEEYKGKRVPKILLSGDHKKITDWRMKEAIKRTKKRRPDLLK